MTLSRSKLEPGAKCKITPLISNDLRQQCRIIDTTTERLIMLTNLTIKTKNKDIIDRTKATELNLTFPFI